MFNAAKYATAFPVIALSAAKYHMPLVMWRTHYKQWWVVSAAVNTIFSFYWDCTHDWDFGLFTKTMGLRCRNPLLRTDLLYPSRAAYYWLMLSNLFLRVSWT